MPYIFPAFIWLPLIRSAFRSLVILAALVALISAGQLPWERVREGLEMAGLVVGLWAAVRGRA